MVTIEKNWAGNYTYQPASVHAPATVEEVRDIVARAPKIRALGSRHCFHGIADSAELISLDRLDPDIAIDYAASTVSVSAGVRYGVLARALEDAGCALHNMASLPHISVAGAVATATHGSGDRNGNLATAVRGMELVTADGDLLTVTPDDPEFAGMVVHLGALGVVTRLTLEIQPTYWVRQQVFEGLSWDVLYARFDEIMGSADSVSLFTDYGENVDATWLKCRVDPNDAPPLLTEFHGATPAGRHRHPVARLAAESCTDQLGVAGAWLDRLPHFRMEAVPASGDEIQAEYMIPRQHAVAALQAIRELAPVMQPHLWTSEIRSVAADELWLSTAYGRETICIHFSFTSEPDAVARLLPLVEDALSPFDPRPHWGKVFLADADELAERYERMAEFRRLAERLDPRGVFRNAFLDRHLFG